jgi:hypothetical protein
LGRGAGVDAGEALAVLVGEAPSTGVRLASVRTAGAAIAVNSFRDGIGLPSGER